MAKSFKSLQCLQIHNPSLEKEDGVAITLIPVDTETGVVITEDSIEGALLAFTSINVIMLETGINSEDDTAVVAETGIEAVEDADVHVSAGFRIISTHDVFS